MRYILEYNEEDLYKTKYGEHKKVQPKRLKPIELSLGIAYSIFGNKPIRRRNLQELMFYINADTYVFNMTAEPSSRQFNSMFNYLIMKDYIVKDKQSSKKVFFTITKSGATKAKKILSSIDKISNDDVQSFLIRYTERLEKFNYKWNDDISLRSFIDILKHAIDTGEKEEVIKHIPYLILNNVITYDGKSIKVGGNKLSKELDRILNEDPSSIRWISIIVPKNKLKKYSELIAAWDMDKED